jgi:Zn-dependent protease
LTLNPLKHLDPIGTLLLLFAGYGWAKPVPINPMNFRNANRDLIIVSIAGIVGNLLTAIVFVMIKRLFPSYFFSYAGLLFIEITITLNVRLAAFNH